MPALSKDKWDTSVVYQSPIEAPIKAGQEIAELVIKRDGMDDARMPLVADRDIARGGFLPRMRTATKVLFAKISNGI